MPARHRSETTRRWRPTPLLTGLLGLAIGGLFGIGTVESSLEGNLRRSTSNPKPTISRAATKGQRDHRIDRLIVVGGEGLLNQTDAAGLSAAFAIEIQGHGLGVAALPLDGQPRVADWDFDVGIPSGWSGPASVHKTATGLFVRTTSLSGWQLYSSDFRLAAGHYGLVIPFELIVGGLAVKMLNIRTLRFAAGASYSSVRTGTTPAIGVLDFTVPARGEYQLALSNLSTSGSSSSWKLGNVSMYRLS
jgi:hypothetical protein